MVGRGALGNPEIFSEILGVTPPMTKKQAIIKHISVLSDYMEEEQLCKHMRKHLLWYLAGDQKLKLFRDEIIKVKSKQEIMMLLNKIFD